jgi:DNA-binding response OmpR family regulator
MKNCPCCGQELPSNKLDKDLIDHPDLKTFSFNGFVDLQITPRQYMYLKMLFDKVGQAIHRDTFFDKVIGYGYDGETRTIDMAVVRLRRSLALTKYSIKSVRGVGYMLVKNELNQSAA